MPQRIQRKRTRGWKILHKNRYVFEYDLLDLKLDRWYTFSQTVKRVEDGYLVKSIMVIDAEVKDFKVFKKPLTKSCRYFIGDSK